MLQIFLQTKGTSAKLWKVKGLVIWTSLLGQMSEDIEHAEMSHFRPIRSLIEVITVTETYRVSQTKGGLVNLAVFAQLRI